MRSVSILLAAALLLASPATLVARTATAGCCPLMKHGMKHCPIRAKVSCGSQCGMRHADPPMAMSSRVVLPIALDSFAPAPQRAHFEIASERSSRIDVTPEPPPPRRA